MRNNGESKVNYAEFSNASINFTVIPLFVKEYKHEVESTVVILKNQTKIIRPPGFLTTYILCFIEEIKRMDGQEIL